MRIIDAESLVLEVDCLETCTCRKAHGWMVPVNEVCRTIAEAPTIDAVPVKHGEWIKVGEVDECGNQYYQCSNCGKGEIHVPIVEVSFCWNCGAKMDGERKDDEGS